MKLEAKKLSKSFDGRQIVENISIHLKEGELVCLLGASGVGKTTIFNMLSGLMQPEAGSVLLNGSDITGKAGRVSYMLQNDLLLPYKTVLDNVALPLVIKGTKKAEARKEASVFFSKFGIEGSQKQYPNQLSGGMRQRAALLRTYLFSHEVALLDEPFSALDTITKSSMHQWYLEVMEQIKLSTLFITHDIDEAILLSDRIYILTGMPGRVAEEIHITAQKPRGQDFLLTEEFIKYKKYILDVLN